MSAYDPNDAPLDGMWGGEPIPLSDEPPEGDDCPDGTCLPFDHLARFSPRAIAPWGSAIQCEHSWNRLSKSR